MTAHLYVRITPGLLRDIKAEARAQAQTVSQLVRRWLAGAVLRAQQDRVNRRDKSRNPRH